jgi:hypothetical protein
LKSLHLEIHYNNPEGDTNATDSSGLTALITTTPRDIECVSCSAFLCTPLASMVWLSVHCKLQPEMMIWHS